METINSIRTGVVTPNTGKMTMKTKETNMRTLSRTALGAVVCLLGLSASAATVWTGAINSEFGIAGNWDNGAPGSPETVATIGNGDTVSNTVDYAGTNTYELTVNGGSTLNSSADFTSDKLTIGDGSTLNLTGGSYSLRKTSANNNATKTVISGASTLHITGGTHTFKERMQMSSDSTFRITGDMAIVNVHQQSGFEGTLNFVFNSDGVSTFDSDSYWGMSGAKVLIDASGYTGPSATFVLFDVDLFGGTYLNSNGFGTVNPVIGPTGYTCLYDQSQIQTNGQITLTLIEPGGATTILYDAFSTNGLGTGVNRDTGWGASLTDWAWSSGQMVNAGATKGMGRVVPVPAEITTENKLVFRLTYTGENVSTPLYVHLWGLKDVSSTPTTWIMNTGGTAGMWYSAGTAFE